MSGNINLSLLLMSNMRRREDTQREARLGKHATQPRLYYDVAGEDFTQQESRRKLDFESDVFCLSSPIFTSTVTTTAVTSRHHHQARHHHFSRQLHHFPLLFPLFSCPSNPFSSFPSTPRPSRPPSPSLERSEQQREGEIISIAS